MRVCLPLGLTLAALALLSAACAGDAAAPPSPSPLEETARLRAKTFPQIMAALFPQAPLEVNALQVSIAEAPEWSLNFWGRLIGQLDEDAALEMAAFFAVEGPNGQRAPGLGLAPGLYVAFVSLDARGQLQPSTLAVLTEGRQQIAPIERARGLIPFRQGTVDGEIRLSVAPALATDIEGDGRQEMVLALRQDGEAFSWQTYSVYQLQPDGQAWRQIGDVPGEAPALTILDYWANVGAAISTARRWDHETRLRVIWPWLAEESAPVTEDLLQELAPEAAPSEASKASEALSFIRKSFVLAYANYSADLQVRQPWAGFVNGFRNTEEVTLGDIGPPVMEDVGKAEVEALLTLVELEGEEARSRQFLVTFKLERLEGRWFLDDLDAQEQPPAD